MDIILNTLFNNPKLPVPGFADDFNRAASSTSMGNTSRDGKPWRAVKWGSNDPVWGITSNGTAQLVTASSNHQAVVVDSESSDGALEATIVTVSPTNWGGLAARVIDSRNLVVLRETGRGSSAIALYEFVDGTQKLLGQGGQVAAGDRLRIEFVGSTVEAYQNGEKIISATTSVIDGQAHGLYAYNPSQGNPASEWDEIKFTPA